MYDGLLPEDWAEIRRLHDLIDRNGGGTVSLSGETLPTKGFFVGGIVPERVALTVTWNTIGAFVSEHLEHLIGYGRFLGAWVDPDTGKTHLDVCDHWPIGMAVWDVAKHRKQTAIYDICCNESLPVWGGE